MIWIYNTWPKIGGSIALLIILFLALQQSDWATTSTLAWIHLALLQLHQFEEYVYPGGFKAFYNQHIYGKNPITRSPLSDVGILLVNVGLGWTAYGLAAYYYQSMPWLTVGLLFITFTNGLLHSVLALILKQYNPGFLTGLFLFIPFSLFMLIKIYGELPVSEYMSALFVFLIGTAAIPLGIFLSQQNSTTHS